MTIIEVHARLANTALFYTILMALWGLWLFIRKQNINSSYWGALAIAEVLYVVQGLLGAWIWLSGLGRPIGMYMHILYGVVCVLVVPGIFLYTHGTEERRSVLLYAIGFLFLIGILLRSAATGAA